jgi:putative Ca2+/H+ antiporter (TMEM165/GDT1 family)
MAAILVTATVARQAQRFIINQAVAVATMMVTGITATTPHAAPQSLKAPQKLTGTFAAALAYRAYRECPEV